MKMNFKKFLNKLIPKTKNQKHLDWLQLEYDKGNYLHINDGIINKRK